MKTNTYRYLYKSNKPLPIKILGIMLAAVAVYRFIYNPVISVITALVVIGIFIFQEGIEISFEKNKFRYIWAFGPLNFGQWKELWVIKYIAILKVKLVNTLTARSGLSTTQEKVVLQVSLIAKNNQKLKLIETNDLNQAFEFAKEIGTAQNLQVWDGTAKVGKYI